MQENLNGLVHITADCFYFNLSVLKFELQYEWTPRENQVREIKYDQK